MESVNSEIERMLEDHRICGQDFAERQAIEARTEAESILTATAKALARKSFNTSGGRAR